MELDEELKQQIIKLIQEGKTLPASLKALLFPPETKQMEYELVYGIKEREEETIKQGMLRPNPRTGRPEYLVTTQEEVLVSMWNDITAYSFDTGFPTEKSEKLLSRIIEMPSKEDDLIADFSAALDRYYWTRFSCLFSLKP